MYEIFERLLKERGVTTCQVSKVTGISTAAFTGWKQGKWNFKIDKFQKIADYFDVPLQYLVSGTYDVCLSSDFSSKDIIVTISDEEYSLLQEHASWLEKHEQKHFDKTERETSDEWTVEDIIMLAIKDQLCICRMSLETG